MYNKKFICYCINPNNGLWYSYSDGRINEVEEMDANVMPLIVLYQLKNTIDFDYTNIRISSNKICLNIRLMIGKRLTLFFDKNCLIKDVIEKIYSYEDFGDSKINLLINAKTVRDNQKLSDFKKDELDVTGLM